MDVPRITTFLSFPRATQVGADSCSAIEEAYVHRVSYFLRKQTDLDVFCYALDGPDDLWTVHVRPHLSNADVFVLFSVGTELRSGSGQDREYKAWIENSPSKKQDSLFIIINLRNLVFKHKNQAQQVKNSNPFSVTKKNRLTLDELDKAIDCAQYIYHCIHEKDKKDLWLDGLPIGYPYGYEKQIIDAFASEGIKPFKSGSSNSSKRMQLRHPRMLGSGSPVKWPSLEDFREKHRPFNSPLLKEDIGDYRDDKFVIVDPRGIYHTGCIKGTCLKKLKLEIPEAGPRSELAFPVKAKTGKFELSVGIVVSGGIAPGINAVLEGIVERHKQYCKWAIRRKKLSGASTKFKNTPPYKLTIRVFSHGLIGITENLVPTEIIIGADGNTQSGHEFLERLQWAKSAGGSIISTARHDDLLDGKPERQTKIDGILTKLTDHSSSRVDVLYVIGGEGSMRAAHTLAYRAQLAGKALSIVGIPKTMDNDILWVWQSFGFLSAVEKAREFFTQLETEVRSNPRLCIMQLFGSDSGFVVSHAALAGGKSCLAALIPEIRFSMKKLSEHVRREFSSLEHGIIVLAETAVPIDVEDYIDDPMIGLNNEEKSAVRRFVGSALLRNDEISQENWPNLINQLRKTDNPLTTLETLLNTFKREEMEFLAEFWQRIQNNGGKLETVEERDQSQVTSIINTVIRNKADVWLTKIPSGSGTLSLFGDPVIKAIGYVQKYVTNHMKKSPIFPSNQAKHLQALSTVMSLPYEANAVIWEINDNNLKPSVELMNQLLKRLKETYGRLVAETYLGVPQRRWTEHRDRRVFGQTPDALRTAGLKIVSRVLEKEIQPPKSKKNESITFRNKYRHRVFASEPRHLIRAIGPSCHDVIFGDRMGRLAVDGAMSGYRDFMISQWLTEFVLVPLPLVVLGRKRVPSDGIFWKSVIASTRQPANLWY